MQDIDTEATINKDKITADKQPRKTKTIKKTETSPTTKAKTTKKAEASPTAKAKVTKKAEASPTAKAKTAKKAEASPTTKAKTAKKVEASPTAKAKTAKKVDASPTAKAKTAKKVDVSPTAKAKTAKKVDASPINHNTDTATVITEKELLPLSTTIETLDVSSESTVDAVVVPSTIILNDTNKSPFKSKKRIFTIALTLILLIGGSIGIYVYNKHLSEYRDIALSSDISSNIYVKSQGINGFGTMEVSLDKQMIDYLASTTTLSDTQKERLALYLKEVDVEFVVYSQDGTRIERGNLGAADTFSNAKLPTTMYDGYEVKMNLIPQHDNDGSQFKFDSLHSAGLITAGTFEAIAYVPTHELVTLDSISSTYKAKEDMTLLKACYRIDPSDGRASTDLTNATFVQVNYRQSDDGWVINQNVDTNILAKKDGSLTLIFSRDATSILSNITQPIFDKPYSSISSFGSAYEATLVREGFTCLQ